MKKLLVVLLALGMIGSVFVFADDAAPAPTPKISVEVNDGLIYSTNSTASAFKDYGIDYGEGGPGALVMVTIAASSDTWAYSIAPRYTGGVLSFDHAWASVTPMAGLTAYTSTGGNPAPFGDLDNNGAGAYGTSSIGAFYTMSGFSIGAQVGQLASMSYTAAPIWVGVHYTMADVFQFNAYAKMNDAVATFDVLNITASVQAVPNLTLTAGFDASALSSSSADSAFADVQVGYKISALGVGVVAYDKNLMSGAGAASFFAYNVYASYTVSPAVALGAYLAGTTASVADYQPELQLAWTPVAGTTIKLTGMYDTAVEGNGNLCGTYISPAVTGTGGTTTVACDVKFAY